MAKYIYSRSNVAMNTAQDLITLITAANRRSRGSSARFPATMP